MSPKPPKPKPRSAPDRMELLQGTLHLLVLKILDLEPMHGYGLIQRLEQITRGTFRVNPGSLFPALHKMEEHGWIRAEWRTTENSRRAKFYRLTRAGRRQLETERKTWERLTRAIDWVLGTT